MIQKLMITCFLLGGLYWPDSPKPPEPTAPAHVTAQQNGVVYQSRDLGFSWAPAEAGLPADMNVNYMGALDGRILLGTRNYGLYQSDASGANWRPSADIPFLWFKKITTLYVADRELYAGLNGEGLYKSLDGGNVWLSMSEKLPEKAVWAVLKRDNVLMAGTDNGIFKSADDGKTWQKVCAEGPVSSLAEQDGVWFGGTLHGVVRSRDGGASWERVLSDDLAHKIAVIDGKVLVFTYDITVRPWKEQQARRQYDMIRVSKDRGNTWKNLDRGLPDGDVYAIVKAGKYWICSHGSGLYRSADEGAHWIPVRLPTDMGRFMDLIFVNGVIYGGTGTFGVAGGGGC